MVGPTILCSSSRGSYPGCGGDWERPKHWVQVLSCSCKLFLFLKVGGEAVTNLVLRCSWHVGSTAEVLPFSQLPLISGASSWCGL